MTDENKNTDSDDSQNDVAEKNTKKKLVEKLQSMGVMPGGKAKEKASGHSAVNFSKVIATTIIVLLLVGSIFWMSGNNETSSQMASSSLQPYPMYNNSQSGRYPPGWQAYPSQPYGYNNSLSNGNRQNNYMNNDHNKLMQQQAKQRQEWYQQEMQRQQKQQQQMQKQYQQAMERQQKQQQEMLKQQQNNSGNYPYSYPYSNNYYAQQKNDNKNKNTQNGQQAGQQYNYYNQYPANGGYWNQAAPAMNYYAPPYYPQQGPYYR